MAHLFLGIFVGLAGLVLLIMSIALFFVHHRTIKEKLIWGSIGILTACFLFYVLSYHIEKYNSPHHGTLPTVYDVPMEAHLDTIVTIHGKDTIKHCTIEWND